LDKLFSFRDKIELAVFTIQTEVANKLTANQRLPVMAGPTVLLWSGFDIESLFAIPRTAFSPPPDVNSKVVRLYPADRGLEDIENFRQFIRGCFHQKNKTLVNSVRSGLDWPKEKAESLFKTLDWIQKQGRRWSPLNNT